MSDLQKAGASAAFAAPVQAAAYIIGFALALTILAPVWDYPPQEFLAFLVENETLMVVWHFIIYIVAGVTLVVLVLGLHDRLKEGAPALMQVTTAFGLIWAGLVIASGMLIVHDIGLLIELSMVKIQPRQSGLWSLWVRSKGLSAAPLSYPADYGFYFLALPPGAPTACLRDSTCSASSSVRPVSPRSFPLCTRVAPSSDSALSSGLSGSASSSYGHSHNLLPPNRAI